MPIITGKDLYKQRRQWVVRFDRIHVVSKDHLTAGIEHLIGGKVSIQSQINKVNNGVQTHGNGDGRHNALRIFLDMSQTDQQDWNDELHHMGPVVEKEGPVQQLRFRHFVVQHQRRQRSKTPKQQHVAQPLILGKYHKRQYHRVKGTQVQRQVFQRHAPCNQIVDHGGDTQKRQASQNNRLGFRAQTL